MKNMKKIFTGVAIATTLFASSAVLADSGSKFSAFDGVPSESVSRVELDAVAGDGVWKLLVTAANVSSDLGKVIGQSICKKTSKSCPQPKLSPLGKAAQKAGLKAAQWIYTP